MLRFKFGTILLARAPQARYATVAPGSGNNYVEDKGQRSTRNPYPYPLHSNPTPHQIFHLPFGASKQQIKARYYELVRVHHPDSFHVASLSPDLAHARFRSIKAAYDFLSGRTMSPHPNARPAPSPKNFDPYLHELSQRRRAYYASRGAYKLNEDGSEGWTRPGWGEGFAAPKNQQSQWNPDGKRERLILAFGVMTLVAGLFPTLPFTVASMFMPVSNTAELSTPTPSHSFFPDLEKTHRAAASALAQARQESIELGPERRDSIRQRVRDMNRTTDGPKEANKDF